MASCEFLGTEYIAQEGAVSRLTTEFVRNESRKIEQKWIIFIYKKNGFNEVKAREELMRDEGVRKKVDELFADRDRCDDREIKSAIDREIDVLLRGRNHLLGTLHQVPTDQLIFDFHWFTVPQALKYLENIRNELESDPRAVLGEIRVELIVGGGDYPGSIRRAFLRQRNVRGVRYAQFLTIPKKVENRV